MKLYEKEFIIPLKEDYIDLLKYFSEYLSNEIPSHEIPIRFVITKTDDKGYHCELGVLSEINNTYPIKPIFDFKKRPYESNEEFNVALVIPTGIDAELGGHSGDAGALARLIASTCDNLITHPNVVNASDINEMTENTLYVEGSVLSRLMMGTIGLKKVRLNNLLVVLDEHEDKFFSNVAINTVSAARACSGFSCDVVRLENRFKMKSEYSKSGRAIGVVENLEGLYDILHPKRSEYNAVAISSVIDVDSEIRKNYYSGGIVNPWGGVEAILTHAVSSLFDIPTAHSPMEPSKETMNMDFGIVDPRMATENVSTTYLYCILKGLHKSPKIITDSNLINEKGIISAVDINCLIIPDGCVGLPTLAALEQGIPVISVKENKNLMKNNLGDLPWGERQLISVENYLEAVGIICALKSGISPESVRRPLEYTKVTNTFSIPKLLIPFHNIYKLKS